MRCTNSRYLTAARSIQDNGIRYLPKGLFRSLKALESL